MTATTQGDVKRILHSMTLAQLKAIEDRVYHIEYNENHPDDTFNAGVWDVFFTYSPSEQIDIINEAKV